MNRIIKAGDRSHGLKIASLDGGLPSALPASAPDARQTDPIAEEIGRLRALVEEKEAENAALSEAVDKARAEGEEAGRIAMELEFEDGRERALELLEAGIGMARESLDEFLVRAEILALEVARTALNKLFGQDDGREAAVVDLVRHQLSHIERQSLVAIEVSRLDFPDTREVAALAERMGVDAAMLAASDELNAGGCRMRMKLGTIDVGLDQQWVAIRELLDSMAGPGVFRP